MIEKQKNGLLFDNRCFLNADSKCNYIARLKWIHLSALIVQYRVVYEHCKLVEKLLYTYQSILSACDSENSGLVCVSQEVHIDIEEKHKGESVKKVIETQCKQCQDLKGDSRKAQNVIFDCLKNFDAQKWWNSSELLNNAPKVNWTNLIYLVAFEKFLYECIKLDITAICNDQKTAKREEAKRIQTYWQIFSEQYTKEDFEVEKETNDIMLCFLQLQENIDTFFTLYFPRDLSRITGQNDIYSRLLNKETDCSARNKGNGLNIDCLFEFFEQAGYEEDRLKIPTYEEFMLPAILSVADQELFERMFPVTNPEEEISVIQQNKIFQKVWDYTPERDAFIYALLNSPCEWPVGAEPLDEIMMEGALQTLYPPTAFTNEKDVSDEDEECYAQEEEENKEVVMALLNHVYTQYPELKEHMEEIAQEYPELKERLGL